jgi:hypothetical protein
MSGKMTRSTRLDQLCSLGKAAWRVIVARELSFALITMEPPADAKEGQLVDYKMGISEHGPRKPLLTGYQHARMRLAQKLNSL